MSIPSPTNVTPTPHVPPFPVSSLGCWSELALRVSEQLHNIYVRYELVGAKLQSVVVIIDPLKDGRVVYPKSKNAPFSSTQRSPKYTQRKLEDFFP